MASSDASTDSEMGMACTKVAMVWLKRHSKAGQARAYGDGGLQGRLVLSL
jgi:hypothetical protein